MKKISLIKENPNITQEQLAVKLGLTRDGVSYNIKNWENKEKLKEQVQQKVELG